MLYVHLLFHMYIITNNIIREMEIYYIIEAL